MLWNTDELILLAVFLAAFLIATESGFRLGIRRVSQSVESDKVHVDALQAAVLGLLALLLGFTFFMSVSRFDARKSLVLDEANAIGTTFLRSNFLPDEQRTAAQGLLRTHVAARLAFYAAGIDPSRMDAANTEAARVERELWALATQAASQAPPLCAGQFVHLIA